MKDFPNPRNLEELLALNPKDLENILIPEEVIFSWLELCDAAWYHSGNPEDPHAELTSGLCSGGFFNCLEAFKYVTILEICANQLALRVRKAIGNQKIDWVIGSPMSGITYSYMVARALGVKKCFFVDKDCDNSGKMLWKRTVIPEKETVLNVEELITTSKTLKAIREAINENNPHPVNWLPYVAVFVHRPTEKTKSYFGIQVIPVIEKEVWAVPKSECDLCDKGSIRYKPKTHWRELIAKKVNRKYL